MEESAQMQEVSSKFSWLNFALATDDLESSATLLADLKVLLIKFPSLFPSFEKTPNAVAELKLARAIYEHAVLLSLKVKDCDALERNLCQLRALYMDTRGIIPTSPDEYLYGGLNLLKLLAENRLAEFHTELELLPLEALDHPCIKYVVDLEKSFMEGTYSRLFNARQAVPHESYVYFMDRLTQTVRDEIAECSGQAYDFLTVPDAMKMLMFTSAPQLLEYISNVQHEWEVRYSWVVRFEMAKSKPRAGIPLQIIKQVLSYAQELEQIV